MGHVGGRHFSVGELHAASKTSSACMGFWYIRSRISTAVQTRVFGLNRPWEPIHQFTPKTRVFFCCGNSAADISKPHTFKWGTLADVVFPSANFAASKTSSANGSHLNVWDFDMSAAEFPQQKKRTSLVWLGPNGLFRPTAEKPSGFFCCWNSAADISKPYNLNGARWRTTFWT